MSILAAGPVAASDIGRLLARQGVTKARDPGAAVRRALRDDSRVLHLHDGRLARVDQALSGIALTTRVTREARERGILHLDGDLAPLGPLGLDAVDLPDRAAAGDLVVVRVEDGASARVSVAVMGAGAGARAADEAELAEAVAARLARTNAGLAAATSIARLAPLFVAVSAARPDAFRVPGRPLTEALREAGWEVHLGWVGGRGTAWASVTEEEVAALEADVAQLLAAERALDAARAQDRVVTLVRRHLPERAPEARRRLARVLARAGRHEHGLAVLTAAMRFRDPEDSYEAALLAVRSGDAVRARRWVNEGLALAPEEGELAACLEDLASDLDAQAALVAARESLHLPGARHDLVMRYARAIVAPRRSYLVEALVDEAFAELEYRDAARLMEAMAGAGDAGVDACHACAAVLPEALATVARSVVEGTAPRRAWVEGLVDAMPVRAWATHRDAAPDQQQLLIVVGKELRRCSGLVVLRDFLSMGGAVKDAFFLPDLVEARLAREVFAPMAELGVPSHPTSLRGAVAALRDGLELTDERGWEMPSSARQNVRERIDRWVLGRLPA